MKRKSIIVVIFIALVIAVSILVITRISGNSHGAKEESFVLSEYVNEYCNLKYDYNNPSEEQSAVNVSVGTDPQKSDNGLYSFTGLGKTIEVDLSKYEPNSFANNCCFEYDGSYYYILSNFSLMPEADYYGEKLGEPVLDFLIVKSQDDKITVSEVTGDYKDCWFNGGNIFFNGDMYCYSNRFASKESGIGVLYHYELEGGKMEPLSRERAYALQILGSESGAFYEFYPVKEVADGVVYNCVVRSNDKLDMVMILYSDDVDKCQGIVIDNQLAREYMDSQWY